MESCDIEIANAQDAGVAGEDLDAKKVAFLQSRTKSTETRLETAKRRYMEPPTGIVNPWERRTIGLFSSPLRSLKTIILIPIVAVRIACLLLCMLVLFVLVSISIRIACLPTPSSKPVDVTPVKMPLRFWIFMYPTKFIIRAALFCFGFHWVSWTGRPASKKEAPIVCPNHGSWVETFYVTGALLCTGMARHDTARQPVVSSFVTALQFVLVDRLDPESRVLSVKAMEARVHDPDFPQFMIFPEGVVNNGKYLTQFKDGPFRFGLPVQPVHITWPFEKWCSGYDPLFNVADFKSVPRHALRALFEFHNPMHVHWLDVYQPSEEEKKDSVLYATNVRAYMSKKTGVPCTEHTFDDVQMLIFAHNDLRIEDELWAVVEMGKARDELHFKIDDAKKILQRFENVDPGKTGKVNMQQFLNVLHLPRTPLTEKVFELYDLNGDGEINFREYLCAQALLRGISDCKGREEEHAVSGSPLHPDSLDFAWQVLTGGAEGKNTIEYEDVKNVFRRYSMPTSDGAMIQKLFDKAKADKPAMDRAAFDAFMSSTPEYMQLLRLGERQRSALAGVERQQQQD